MRLYPYGHIMQKSRTRAIHDMQLVLGLFAPPQSPFCTPCAAPNQSPSTGLSRRHVGCLVLHFHSLFWALCTPHWAHFTGWAAHPPPFGCLKLCLCSLFWGFSFHPDAAILRAGCFPQ